MVPYFIMLSMDMVMERRAWLALVKRWSDQRERKRAVAVPRGRAGDAPSRPSRLPNDRLVLDVTIQHDCWFPCDLKENVIVMELQRRWRFGMRCMIDGCFHSLARLDARRRHKRWCPLIPIMTTGITIVMPMNDGNDGVCKEEKAVAWSVSSAIVSRRIADCTFLGSLLLSARRGWIIKNDSEWML